MAQQRGRTQRAARGARRLDGVGGLGGLGGGGVRAVGGLAHGAPPFLWPNTGGWVFMSISGTQMFISNTAKAMPSG